MDNKIKSEMEKKGKIIFSIIPVEHLVINSIDRLGDYLLVYVPFLLLDDYQTVVELDENEKKLIAILLSKREIMEILKYFIKKNIFLMKYQELDWKLAILH